MNNPYRRRPNPASPGPLTYGATSPTTNPYAGAAQRPAVQVTVQAPTPPGQQPAAADDPIARLLADPGYQALSPEVRGFLQARVGQPLGQAPVPSASTPPIQTTGIGMAQVPRPLGPQVAQPGGVGHGQPASTPLPAPNLGPLVALGDAVGHGVPASAPAPTVAPETGLPPGFRRAVDQAGAPPGQMRIERPDLGLVMNVPDPSYVAPAPVVPAAAAPPVAPPETPAAPPAAPPVAPPPLGPLPAPNLGPLGVRPDGTIGHLAPPPPEDVVPGTRTPVSVVRNQARVTPGFAEHFRTIGGDIETAQPAVLLRAWQEFNTLRGAQAQQQAQPGAQQQQQQLAQQGWSAVPAGGGAGFSVRDDFQPPDRPTAARFARDYIGYLATAHGLPDETRRQLLGMTDEGLRSWLAGGMSKLIPVQGRGNGTDQKAQDILRRFAGGAFPAPAATPATPARPASPAAPPPPVVSPEEQNRAAAKADPALAAFAQRLGIDLNTATPDQIRRLRDAQRPQPAGATGFAR